MKIKITTEAKLFILTIVLYLIGLSPIASITLAIWIVLEAKKLYKRFFEYTVKTIYEIKKDADSNREDKGKKDF